VFWWRSGVVDAHAHQLSIQPEVVREHGSCIWQMVVLDLGHIAFVGNQLKPAVTSCCGGKSKLPE
jgi:hypothetical protein